MIGKQTWVHYIIELDKLDYTTTNQQIRLLILVASYSRLDNTSSAVLVDYKTIRSMMLLYWWYC